MGSSGEPEFWLDWVSNKSGLAVTLTWSPGLTCWSQQSWWSWKNWSISYCSVQGHSSSAWRACWWETDHDNLLSSAEPGHKGSSGVAALILGTVINALHAVSAVSLLSTFVPETLSEFYLSVNGVLANWADDSGCHAWSPKGGVVIVKLEQWVYLLMAAPAHCL